MIQQRIIAGKTFGGKKLFCVQRTVWFAELCMTFVRYITELLVKWHKKNVKM